MNKSLIATFIFFTIIACHKEKHELEELAHKVTSDCHQANNFNEQELFDYLVGEWNWFYTESIWRENKGNITSDENLKILINSDSTLKVIRGNIAIGDTKWTLEYLNSEHLYQFKLDSQITELYGRIQICSGILKCNNSFIGGSDNYFAKNILVD